jgi:hypothetical protein
MAGLGAAAAWPLAASKLSECDELGCSWDLPSMILWASVGSRPL